MHNEVRLSQSRGQEAPSSTQSRLESLLLWIDWVLIPLDRVRGSNHQGSPGAARFIRAVIVV